MDGFLIESIFKGNKLHGRWKSVQGEIWFLVNRGQSSRTLKQGRL